MNKPRKKTLTAEFDYFLPPALIAQEPIRPRDHSRLLVLSKKTGRIKHGHFYDLLDILCQGDVLVLNNSRVIPARLLGQKETGGQTEIFLLQKSAPKQWQCLIGGKIEAGQKIKLRPKIFAWAEKKLDERSWLLRFNVGDQKLFSLGQTPLPPYIKKTAKLADYQTVYAKNSGSVAAPTAGLHFTPALLRRLGRRGVQIEYLTLHVGLGTFAPVKSEYLEDHPLHAELATIDPATARRLNRAKQEGRRIIAVGTTSARTLEAFAAQGKITAQSAWINIFIYPGYQFKFVDALITNFHLPQSTLLALVSALAGSAAIKKAYAEAIKQKYRFFSFGDAMMIE